MSGKVRVRPEHTVQAREEGWIGAFLIYLCFRETVRELNEMLKENTEKEGEIR